MEITAVNVGVASLVAAIGLWLMLPPQKIRLRSIGGLLVAIGFGLLASMVAEVRQWAAASLFWILAGVTLAAAVATVTSRNPVYSAIWFALSLLGTGALFFYQGAQFLAVATVVVYAGAIVVTLLFVLMLAQPDGTAFYDRISWGRTASLLSALAGMAIVGVLTLAFASLGDGVQAGGATPEQLATQVLHDQHVARLGGQLFARHLISIEIAGLLLLVALIGAVALAAHARRPAAEEEP
jgi:NADH-quinone oxidoreductase subunit J